MNSPTLYTAILAVCPIDGYTVDKDGTVNVQYSFGATAEQRAAAAAVIKSFDPTIEAQYYTLSLPEYQIWRVSMLNEQLTNYIYSHYPPPNQQTISVLLTQSMNPLNPMPNRAAYIGQLWTWIASVITYWHTIQDAIAAATTNDQVRAVIMDVSQFDATDPQITIYQTMGINN